MIYLASPYSHKDPEVRQARYEAARDCLDFHLKYRRAIISPIVLTHELARTNAMDFSADAWVKMNKEFMLAADKMFVLGINGWKNSKGVTAEVEFWRLLDRPLFLTEKGDHVYITNPL